MHSVRNFLRLRRLYSSPRIHSNQAFTSSRRRVHTLPHLPYNIDDGLGEFLSPAALHMIAVDYQQGLLTRLNEQVKGTEMENQSVIQTVISAAGHRRHALAFNYASQALNNSFFLEYLKPPPPGKESHEEYLGTLAEEIRLNFGTLAQLKSTFSAAAMGMINSGWVWLVSDERGSMQVVGTFGAGTLLVRSRRHMLEDPKKPILGEAQASVYEAPLTKSSSRKPPPSYKMSPAPRSRNSAQGLSDPTHSRPLHTSAVTKQFKADTRPHIFAESPVSLSAKAETEFDQSGDILTPLLCVSVYEHAWMGGGYGIWGKEEYLKRFWTVVDWQAVGQAYQKAVMYR